MRDWLRYCSYNSDIELPCLNCKSFVKKFEVLTFIMLDRLLGTSKIIQFISVHIDVCGITGCISFFKTTNSTRVYQTYRIFHIF